MKIKKLSALFGLFIGATILLAFASPPEYNYNCRLTVVNHSTTNWVGIGGYGVQEWIAPGASAKSRCLCAGNPAPYKSYIQVYGPSKAKVNYTVSSSDTTPKASGTISTGVTYY